MAAVEESWKRIVDWLNGSARVTAAALSSSDASSSASPARAPSAASPGGASPGGASSAASPGGTAFAASPDLAGVERVLGRQLPADLAGWWKLAGDVSGAENLIPLEHTPLSIPAALDARRDRLDHALRHGESIVDGEAGDPTRGFHSAFVPIAHDPHGRYLFVDLRGGPLYGCVGEWDDIGGFVDVVSWPSVAEMLSDIADALVHGVPALTFHAAGRLRHFAGHPEVPVLTCRAAVTPAGRLMWAT